MQGIVIELAQVNDMPLAADLRAAMAVEMGGDWDADHPGWRERFAQYFRERQELGESQLFQARAGDQIVGMAFVSMVDDYHGFVRHKKSGRVNSVYVIPSFRRRGVARSLMLAAIDWLRTKDCVVVRLNASEVGVALYESLGFKPRREMEFSLESASSQDRTH